MNINSIRDLAPSNDYIDGIIRTALVGNTVLFVGAGYSMGTKSKDGVIGDAKCLSKEICRLGHLPEDEDLAYTSNQFLKNNPAEMLIDYLIQKLSVVSTSPSQETIAGLPWRRIYTTNYDNCIEYAASGARKQITPLDLSDDINTYFNQEGVCIHINGYIKKLNRKSLNHTFKLTESSYSQSANLLRSPWLYRLKKDIELSNQIIFIGYSLYDIEIRYILSDYGNIKKKTYFIIAENASGKEINKLNEFGNVLPIGMDRFSDRICPIIKDTSLKTIVSNTLYSLSKITPVSEGEYSESEVRDFELYGRCNDKHIVQSLTNLSRKYSIERDASSKIVELLKNTRCVAIRGNMASGKSVILKQVSAMLAINNNGAVYCVTDDSRDHKHDIDIISKESGFKYLIVDSASGAIDIIKYFYLQCGEMGRIVVADRSRRVDRMLDEAGINDAKEISVDLLSDDEVSMYAKLLKACGLLTDRIDIIENSIKSDCGAQIDILLARLIEAPQQVARLDKALSECLSDNETKSVIFGICIACVVLRTQYITKSIVSRITHNMDVYKASFGKLTDSANIFMFEGERLETRSSLLAQFVLRHCFNASYTIDRLIDIMEELDQTYRALTCEEKDCYNGLMRFSTLASILPNQNKDYVKYYEDLHSRVLGVDKNPHFWLQYAMALISCGKIDHAERMINNAYKVANIRSSGYDTLYIDNQMARLLILKAIAEIDPKSSIDMFTNAHKLLTSGSDDEHKYRVTALYVRYFREKMISIGGGHRARFEHALKSMIEQYQKYLDREYPTGAIPLHHLNQMSDLKSAHETATTKRIRS